MSYEEWKSKFSRLSYRELSLARRALEFEFSARNTIERESRNRAATIIGNIMIKHGPELMRGEWDISAYKILSHALQHVLYIDNSQKRRKGDEIDHQ